MASSKPVTINLMVDTTRNRVLFADCGGDFVDIVLSYLTLPMSSVFRLTGNDGLHAAGSINNIYGSVLSLENHYFRNKACKSMLLHPLDAAVSKIQNSLAMSVEYTSETRSLFYCQKCFLDKRTVCLYSGAKCACGGIMNGCVSSRIGDGIKRPVFVKEGFRYIITDDFMISKASTDSVVALMQNISIGDRGRMEKREVHVKSSHVLHLLKCCLVSAPTLLSDTFLDNKETTNRTQPPEEISRSHVPTTQAVEGESSSPTNNIVLKLFVNKIDKKLVHAETCEEFVDFLFSILCIPVGCIAMLLDSQINLGCLQNIHRSVASLSAADCIKNSDMKNVLASPKSPPSSTIKNKQLIKLVESNPEILLYCSKFPNCDYGKKIEIDTFMQGCCKYRHIQTPVSLHDPKQYPSSESTTGFLTKSGYMISDDLNIKVLSGITVASNLLNAAVEGELELITVEVGPQQALDLLRASVTSKTALTDVFLRNREVSKQRLWKKTYPAGGMYPNS